MHVPYDGIGLQKICFAFSMMCPRLLSAVRCLVVALIAMLTGCGAPSSVNNLDASAGSGDGGAPIEDASNGDGTASSDGTRTLIAEVRSPHCSQGRVWACFTSRVRSEVDAKYQLTSSPLYPAGIITIRGHGFFDFVHFQNGVAPNATKFIQFSRSVLVRTVLRASA